MSATPRRTSAAVIVFVFALTGCQSEPAPQPTPSADSGPMTTSVTIGSVIVDFTNPAYTVFTKVASGTNAAELAHIREWLDAHRDATFIAGEAFAAGAKDLLRAHVAKDDYPECDLAEGVTRLLEKYPGTPFGVTWNGGLAFTRNDYRHAERLRDRWHEDAGTRTRPVDRRDDPIHPRNHLDPLLGR